MQQPPYPAATKAGGFRFELDYERIIQSDTWALADARQRPLLLMTGFVAWQQTPCGSLPSDDLLIAARLGVTIGCFQQDKPILLRGWTEASDGRLYHPEMTEQVLEMVKRKAGNAGRQAAYRNRLRQKDDRNDGVAEDSQMTNGGVTHYSGVSDDTTTTTTTTTSEPIPDGIVGCQASSDGPGRRDGKTLAKATPKPKASPGGTRLPDGWTLPKPWSEWALSERSDMTEPDIQREAACFADYWHGKAGADARKASWEATWRNWIRRAVVSGNGLRAPPPGPRKPIHSGFEHIDYGKGGML